MAVTDYTFESLEIEKSILEPLGCRIVDQRSGTDVRRLIALVEDADYVITQFAPVRADVITAMQRCRLIVRYGIGVDNVALAAAAMDVTDPEPIDPGSPLLKMPNVIINTHVASTSTAAMRKLRTEAANTVAIAVRGGKPPNAVNGVGG